MSGPLARPAALSDQAMAYGRQCAAKMLSGRTGHGGGPCTYRQLRERDLIALCAIAFDAGRNSADQVQS